MNLRRAVRGSLPYAVAIVGGFLVAYLIVALFVFPSGVIPPRDAKIPSVTGLSFDEALKRLSEWGFKGERGESRFDAATPKETVLDQAPVAGTRQPQGSTVTLSVSGGQRTAAVPQVIGMAREQADSALEQAGFSIGDISERQNDAPAGQVLDTRPRPGTRTNTPSSVAIVVSAGPRLVAVPDIAGQSVAAARKVLQQAGLVLGDVNSAYAGSLENATVTSQSPPAASQVPAGTRVSVIASGGRGGPDL